VPLTSVHDLRRIADAVSHLRDRLILDVALRADCRQLRLVLDDGQSVLLAVRLDSEGRPRLDADLLRGSDEGPTGQLEVQFDGTD
jgi:hypothetical protein